ncbi:Ribosome silencing factor [Balamuthia mandrillaris]
MKREACASLLAPHWRGRAFHCGAACSPSTAFFPRLLSSSTALHLQRTKTVASSVIVAPSPLFPPVAKPPNRFLLSSYACYATSSSSSSSSSSSGKRSSSSSRKGYLEKQRKTVEHIQHGGGAAAKKTTKKPKDNERLAPVTSDRDKKSALLSQRKTRKGIDKFAAAEGSPSSRKKKTATTRRKERSDETSQPVEFVGQVGLVNPPSKTAALKPRLKKKEEERYLTVHDPEYQNLPPPLHLEDVVRLLKEEKALRLFAVDISQKCNYTNYMITVEGRSGRHMRGMAEKILAAVRARKRNMDPTIPVSIEGYENNDWMVMDCGDIVVHFFSAGARRYYDLEGLWVLRGALEEELAKDTGDVDDLEDLPDDEDVPGGWNPLDM